MYRAGWRSHDKAHQTDRLLAFVVEPSVAGHTCKTNVGQVNDIHVYTGIYPTVQTFTEQIVLSPLN